MAEGTGKIALIADEPGLGGAGRSRHVLSDDLAKARARLGWNHAKPVARGLRMACLRALRTFTEVGAIATVIEPRFVAPRHCRLSGILMMKG